MIDEKVKQEIRNIVREEVRKLFAQADSVPRQVKQRHLEGNIIFFGVAADLPDGSTEVKAFFETDTPALKLWDGSAWQTI